MKIRTFKISDTVDITRLISKTFATFNKKEGTKKAVQGYIDYYNTKKNDIGKIKNDFLQSPLFFVVEAKGKIIGIIRGTKNKMVNLFVDGKYHRQGIGEKLIHKYELEAKKLHSKEIRTRASLYAISFYLNAGYKKTTGIRKFIGLKIQPMKKVLK